MGRRRGTSGGPTGAWRSSSIPTGRRQPCGGTAFIELRAAYGGRCLPRRRSSRSGRKRGRREPRGRGELPARGRTGGAVEESGSRGRPVSQRPPWRARGWCAGGARALGAASIEKKLWGRDDGEDPTPRETRLGWCGTGVDWGRGGGARWRAWVAGSGRGQVEVQAQPAGVWSLLGQESLAALGGRAPGARNRCAVAP